MSGAEVEDDDGVGVVGDVVRKGGVRDEQHPVGRGGKGEHPNCGVAVGVRRRAALRGAVGVVPNSGVLGVGDEFSALVMIGFRCPRRSTWL